MAVEVTTTDAGKVRFNPDTAEARADLVRKALNEAFGEDLTPG